MNVHRIGPWSQSAACRDSDPSVFFPTHETNESVERAVAICRQCPVATECRDYARDALEPAGIWGGELTSDRLHPQGTGTGRLERCVECDAPFMAPTARHKLCSENCRTTRRQRQLSTTRNRRRSASRQAA